MELKSCCFSLRLTCKHFFPSNMINRHQATTNGAKSSFCCASLVHHPYILTAEFGICFSRKNKKLVKINFSVLKSCYICKKKKKKIPKIIFKMFFVFSLSHD